jgi:hypothetical protein
MSSTGTVDDNAYMSFAAQAVPLADAAMLYAGPRTRN